MEDNKISNEHISVLLEQTIAALNIKPDGIYVDATLGRGGHSELILSKLNQSGLLIGIDQDKEAIEFCKKKFNGDRRVIIVKDNFVNLKSVLSELKIASVDGILMDLGVSSPQLDNDYRGFSYKNDGPLDMRMDQSQELDAKKVINSYDFVQLCNVFRKYGDIKNPSKVVNNILKYRTIKPIETTFELVNLIKESLPKKELFKSNKHPAKVYFQALRIEVNNEIEVLKNAVNDAATSLNPEGRLVIITFHSLEDKLVVKKFKELSINKLPIEVPLAQQWQEFIVINPKGLKPNENELINNNRSHSSKLRTLKKTCYQKK